MRLICPLQVPISAVSPEPGARWLAFVAVVMAVCLAPAARAEIYTVGSLSCTHGTIANALVSAENNPGPDTIRITRSATYTQQAINVTTSQELTLTGGYADCTTANEDAVSTTLNGSGGALAPVLTINGNTGSLIRLRKLAITGGDVPNNGIAGGGIQYTGNGLLDIADTQITNNTGAFGGGINAGGTGTAAELDIGPNTSIQSNVAHFNGGGVFSNNIETAIRGENISINFNDALGVAAAGGYGGGIHIRACAEISAVYLGSPGIGGLLGVVSGNSARYGGGVAIETPSGCNKAADLRMYSTAAGPTKIDGNIASVSGGGVYISRAGGTANVYVWNASIVGNEAPVASALYLGNAGNAYFNEYFAPVPVRPDGAVNCAIGVPCGALRDNTSTSGQVVYGQGNNTVELQHVEVSGNQGSELIRVNDLAVSDSLIADNVTSNRLLESHNGSVYRSTVAGNQIGASEIFGINTGGSFNMFTSVTWQPGKSILNNDGGIPTIDSLVTNESSSIAGSGTHRILVANPRFIDTVHGNYQPTAASPVVDFGDSLPVIEDLLTRIRSIDLGLVANRYGPTDLGAYERPAIQPLVENGDFASNANVWKEVLAGSSSWDATQNAPGSVGGSLHVNIATTANIVTARVQCIHLPAPGDYSLNGSGKSTGTAPFNPGDDVKLLWELRLNGSESCTGTPELSGGKVLATTSTWNRPVTPTHIVVSPAQWTTNTSIAVYLAVDQGGGIGRTPDGNNTIGWFDDVTLTVDGDPDDVIFKNGFEGP